MKTSPTHTTHFKKDFIKKVDDYLKERQDEEEQIVKQENGEKGYVMYENKLRVRLPTISGFAKYLGFDRKTIYNWESEQPEFAFALEKIRIEQRQRLIDMGLSGDYNSTIAKLMLSHNHGMKERVDNTTDDQPMNTFTDDQVNKIADRIARRKKPHGGTSGEE